MIIKIKTRSPNGIKNDIDKNNKKYINNNHNTHTAIWIKQKVIQFAIYKNHNEEKIVRKDKIT